MSWREIRTCPFSLQITENSNSPDRTTKVKIVKCIYTTRLCSCAWNQAGIVMDNHARPVLPARWYATGSYCGILLGRVGGAALSPRYRAGGSVRRIARIGAVPAPHGPCLRCRSSLSRPDADFPGCLWGRPPWILDHPLSPNLPLLIRRVGAQRRRRRSRADGHSGARRWLARYTKAMRTLARRQNA